MMTDYLLLIGDEIALCLTLRDEIQQWLISLGDFNVGFMNNIYTFPYLCAFKLKENLKKEVSDILNQSNKFSYRFNLPNQQEQHRLSH